MQEFAGSRGGARRGRLPAGRLVALCWLIIALPVVAAAALLVPSGEVADEVAHIVRADSLLHGEIIGHRLPRPVPVAGAPDEAGVDVDAGIFAAGFSFQGGLQLADKKLTAARAAELRAIPWQGPRFAAVPNTAVYPPVFYLPAALGMVLAEAAGARPYHTILAGRLGQGLAFLLIGGLALLLAQCGRGLLLASLTLPMTLSLAGSASQDGVLIATAGLAAALFSRGAYWRGCLALACVIAARLPYFPLALVCLTAVNWGRGAWPRGWARGWGGVALAVLPGLLWTGVAMAWVAVPFVKGAPVPAGPLWDGPAGTMFAATSPGAQLGILLRHPLLLVTLPVRSLLADWTPLWHEAVGVLGWLEIALPDALYRLWAVALAAALLADLLVLEAGAQWRLAWRSALLLAGLLAAVFAIYLAQYLSWSDVGRKLIEGVQGRYLLPLLPFLGLALRPVREGTTLGVAQLLWGPAWAAGLIGALLLPWIFVRIYYLR